MFPGKNQRTTFLVGLLALLRYNALGTSLCTMQKHGCARRVDTVIGMDHIKTVAVGRRNGATVRTSGYVGDGSRCGGSLIRGRWYGYGGHGP